MWTDADMTYPNERIPEFVWFLTKNPEYDQVVGARINEEGCTSYSGFQQSGSFARSPSVSPTPRSQI